MHPKLRVFVICVASLILNYLTAFVFYSTLHIPLFFDTIWTVALVFYEGLVPALLTQLAYNILNPFVWILNRSVFDPFIFCYAICGVLIVLSTWLIARRKEEFKISPVLTVLYLFLITLVSSLFTIITGGVIDFFHFKYFNIPDMVSPIKKFTDSFVHQRFSLLAACILAQIPVSFLDRLLATFSGYGIYRLYEKIMGKRIFL